MFFFTELFDRFRKYYKFPLQACVASEMVTSTGDKKIKRLDSVVSDCVFLYTYAIVIFLYVHVCSIVLFYARQLRLEVNGNMLNKL